MPAPIAWNRSPLPQNRFAHLPLGSIQLRGKLLSSVAAQQGGTLEEQLCRAYLIDDKAEQKAVLSGIYDKLNGTDEDMISALRALIRAYAAVNDASIPQTVQAMLKRLYDHDEKTFTADKTAEAADVMHAALWLYNLTGNKALLALCASVREQGPDWTSVLHTFPQTRAVKETPQHDAQAYWRVHGATLAAALRSCGFRAMFEGGLKNETAFTTAMKKLSRYHGAAHGLFNADPLLAGADPNRGVDAETIDEMIRSLDALQWSLGSCECGDMMARILGNALADGQSVVQTNRLESCEGAKASGLALAASGMWMAAQDGLAAFGYGGCLVRWRIGETPVRVEVLPEKEKITLNVRVREPVRFRLYLRIPAWCADGQCAVSGETMNTVAGSFHVVEREWQDGDTVTLKLPTMIQAVRGYHQSVSVVRGAQTYALPVADGWNYTLLPERGFEAIEDETGDGVLAWAARVPEWVDFESLPILPQVQEQTVEQVLLRPFASAQTRVAQFPTGVIK